MNPNNIDNPQEKHGLKEKIKSKIFKIKEKTHNFLKQHFPERFWRLTKKQTAGHHIQNQDHHKS